MQSRYDSYNLKEVSIARPLLMLMVVVYHVFCVYEGVWSSPEWMVSNSVYSWISRVSYSFMLPMFVFLSAYVNRHSIANKKKTKVGDMLWRRLKRLYFPCLFFGLIYAIMFVPDKVGVDLLLAVLGGVGHLWFLPMLFWCYVFIMLLRPIPDTAVKGTVLFLLSFLSVLHLPLQLHSTLFYLFYFWFGERIYCHRCKIVENVTVNHFLLNFVAYVFAFVLFACAEDWIEVNMSEGIVQKIFLVACRHAYSLLGVTFFYTFSLLISRNIKLCNWYIMLGEFSMGIYIIQQFVIRYIYYNSSMFEEISSSLMPWVTLLITSLMSILLTYILKEQKI